MLMDRTSQTRAYHADLAASALASATTEGETAAALALLWTSVDTVAEFKTRLLDSIEVTADELDHAMAYIEIGILGEASLALGATEHR